MQFLQRFKSFSVVATALFLAACSEEVTVTSVPLATPDSVVVGDVVTLSGTNSTVQSTVREIAVDELSFRWDVTAAPEGASKEIANATQKIAQFTPTLEGNYEITLAVAPPDLHTGGGVASALKGTEAVKATTTITVYPKGASRSRTTIDLQKASVRADGADAQLVTVTVFDALGNAVANQAVSFTSSGSSNVLSAASSTTNAAGIATTTLKSTKAELKAISAAVNGFTFTKSTLFIAGPADPSKTTITLAPTSITANGLSASTATVTAADANNNVILGSAVSFSSTLPGVSFSPPTATTNSSGQATTVVTATKSGSSTITATIDGQQVSTALTIAPGVAAAATSSLSVSPASQKATGTTPVVATAIIRDAQGNPLANTSVTFTTTGTGNTPSAEQTTTTNAQGEATYSLVSTVAENKVITATFGSAQTKTATVSFVAGEPSLANSTMTAQPTVVQADGLAKTIATITLKDANNNLILNTPVSVVMSGTNNIPAAATTVNTGSSGPIKGVASIAFASTTAEQKTIIASFGTPAQSLTATVKFEPLVVIGPPVSTTSTLVLDTTTPAPIASDGVAKAKLILTLKDENAAPVGAGIAVQLASNIASDVLSPAAPYVTDINSQVLVEFASTQSGSHDVTATFGDAQTLTTAVVFAAGAVDVTKSTLTATPATIVASTTISSTLTVILKDSTGTLLANTEFKFDVSGSGNTISPEADVNGNYKTDAAGQMVATLSSTMAETKTVKAIIGAVTIPASPTVVSVVVTPAIANNETSTLIITPAIIPTNGVTTASAVLTLKDEFDNAIVGQSVSFSSSEGAADVITPTTIVTGTNGTATVVISSEQIPANNSIISVKLEGEATSFLSASLDKIDPVEAGAPVAETSIIKATPAQIVADNAAKSTIELFIGDIDNNPAANVDVTVTIGDSAGITVKTNAGGIATVPFQTTKIGIYSVVATFGDAQELTTSITAISGAVASPPSTLQVAGSAPFIADGVSTATITATVLDINSNPVANAPIRFYSNQTGDTPDAIIVMSDENGIAALPFTTKTVGNRLFTVDTNNNLTVIGSIFVDFQPGPVDPSKSTFGLTPASVPADGNTQLVAKIELKDAQSYEIKNKDVIVEFTINGQKTTKNVTTDDAGIAFTNITSLVAGPVTAVAKTADGILIGTQSGVFVAGDVDADASILTVIPASLPANGSAKTQVKIAIKDVNNNAISGKSVTFDLSGTDNTPATKTVVSDENGIALAEFSSTKAEVKTVTVAFGASAPKTAEITFTEPTVVGPASVVTSTVVATSPTIADGSAKSTITVTLLDDNRAAVEGVSVSLTSSGTQNTPVDAQTATTNGNGVATFELASLKAETKTLTATFDSKSITGSAVFQSGAATSITLTSSAETAVVGEQTAPTLTALVVDANANPVSGATLTWVLPAQTTLSAGPYVTALDGTVAVKASSTQAASKLFEVQLNALSAKTTVVYTPSVATKIAFSQTQPISTVAGKTFTLTLIAQDAFGNTATSFVGPMALVSEKQQLDGTLTQTAVLGVATFADVLFSKTGTFTVMSTVDSFTAVESPSIIVSAAPAATITISQITSSFVAGSQTTFTATVVDAFNNPVSNQNVTMTSESIPLVIAPALTNELGIATFADVLLTKAGTYTLKATTQNISATSNEFMVLGGAAKTLRFATAAITVGAGTQFTQQLTAVDEFDNGASGSITVSLAAATLGGTVTKTVTDGVVDFTNLTIQKTGSFTLSAAMNALTATSKTVTITSGSATKLKMLTLSTPLVAGNKLTSSCGLFDAFDNAVTTADVPVAFCSDYSSGTTSCSTEIATNTAGIASFETTEPLTLAKTWTGSCKTTQTGVAQDSKPFVVQPAIANSLTVVASTLSVKTTETFDLTEIQAVDAFGNKATTNGSVTLTKTFESQAPTSLGANATLSNGLGSASGLNISVVGAYLLTAQLSSDTAVQGSTRIQVTASGPAALSFQSQPPAVLTQKGGLQTFGATVEVRDASNAIVANQPVTLSYSGGDSSATLSGTTTINTNSSGLAIFTGLTLNKAGTFKIKAVAGSVSAESTQTIVRPASMTILTPNTSPLVANDIIDGFPAARYIFDLRLLNLDGTPAKTALKVNYKLNDLITPANNSAGAFDTDASGQFIVTTLFFRPGKFQFQTALDVDATISTQTIEIEVVRP